MSSTKAVGRLPRNVARRRIALYSHDAVGLGHVRRNLALAGALGGPETDVLLVTGCPSASVLERPEGCDVVVLPAMAKTDDGGYGSRFLALAPDEMTQVRAAALHGLLTSFAPDLLVVDKHPVGLGGELVQTLQQLRGAGTRTVLGLRDVLDEPQRARREWQQGEHDELLTRFYDEAWVYGDDRVHDLARVLYGDAEPPVPFRQAGYLVPRLPGPRPDVAERPYLLAGVGAGGDGEALLRALVRAPLPPGHRLVVVGGPDLPTDVRESLLAEAVGEIEVHGFHTATRELVAGASAIVSMGGYNSVCEALASGRPTLVVPRVDPRTEQLVRAEAFAEHGLLDVCHPDQADPQRLSEWIHSAVGATAVPDHDLALDGLRRVSQLAEALLAPRQTIDLRSVRAHAV